MNDEINGEANAESSLPDLTAQGHVDGASSQQMRAMLNETLSYYPAHYCASQSVLAEVTNHQRGWRCYGAMETSLTADGMEVTFDYRFGSGSEWRRFLIMVTMADGELTYRDYREMKKGEHCGISVFDALDEDAA